MPSRYLSTPSWAFVDEWSRLILLSTACSRDCWDHMRLLGCEVKILPIDWFNVWTLIISQQLENEESWWFPIDQVAATCAWRHSCVWRHSFEDCCMKALLCGVFMETSTTILNLIYALSTAWRPVNAVHGDVLSYICVELCFEHEVVTTAWEDCWLRHNLYQITRL